MDSRLSTSLAGPMGKVAGLRFSANGKTIPWRRDLLDVFTFHLDVPPGVQRFDVEFDYIESAVDSASDKLVVVDWNPTCFIPRGFLRRRSRPIPRCACPPVGNSGLLCPWRTPRATR